MSREKIVFIAVLCFSVTQVFSQSIAGRVEKRMLAFHDQLAQPRGIEKYLDDSLSYGHSNGWIETRSEFLANLGGKLVYHSVREDSIRVTVNGNVAHIRFSGDFDVSLDGKRNTFHLRVLEVWVKRGRHWKIFARQATR
jgi:hypothetical protein